MAGGAGSHRSLDLGVGVLCLPQEVSGCSCRGPFRSLPSAMKKPNGARRATHQGAIAGRTSDREEVNVMALVRMARQLSAWTVSRMNIRSERGATAVEYGLMVALIAAVIIVAVALLGKNAKDTFNCTANSV